MSTAYIRNIAIYIILAAMLITLGAEVVDVSAQLNEIDEQTQDLINKKFEELNRRDKRLSWGLGISGFILSVVNIFLGYRFKQLRDWDDTINQIRADIQHLQRWCQGLERSLKTIHILLIVYGIILGILAFLTLHDLGIIPN